MSFNYTPKTAAELAAMDLLPDGDYPYAIGTVSDAPSKTSGKPMLTLKVEVYPPEGNSKTVTDYIVMGSAYADKKLFELCQSTGLAAQYANGSLQPLDLEGKSGWCKIGSEKGREKSDGSGNFPDKNRIKWYLREARRNTRAFRW